MMGDLNEVPGNAPTRCCAKARACATRRSQQHDNGGRPGTHGNCTASGKFDYILLSPGLFDKVKAAGVAARHVGRHDGTLWPHFNEVTRAEEAASDHAAVWVELDI